MTKFAWTFEPRDVIEFSDAERFIQVYATTYEKAVKKILKLKLPNVHSEEDLKFISVQEEAFGEDEDDIQSIAN